MENTLSKPTISVKNMVLCSMFTALIAIGAFIQIPIPMMDYFTLQFFFVLMAGLVLGGKNGAISVITYLFIGLIGVPVFAAGGGIGYVLRPSFGYLVGFVFSAYAVGTLTKKSSYEEDRNIGKDSINVNLFERIYVAENRSKNSFFRYFLACFVGMVITYAIGIAYKYLMLNYYANTPATIWAIFLSGFPLDMPGDLVLCVLASAIRVKINRVVDRI